MRGRKKQSAPLLVRTQYADLEERLFGLHNRETAPHEAVPCDILFDLLGAYFREVIDASCVLPQAPKTLLALCERGFSAAFLAVLSECAAVLSPMAFSFEEQENHILFHMEGNTPKDVVVSESVKTAAEAAWCIGLDASLFAYMERVGEQNGFRIYASVKGTHTVFSFSLPIYNAACFAVRTPVEIKKNILDPWPFTLCFLMNRHLSFAEQDRCFVYAKKETEKRKDRL